MSMNATVPPPIPATLLLRNARTQKGAFCVIVKMATGKSARRVKVNFKKSMDPLNLLDIILCTLFTA